MKSQMHLKNPRPLKGQSLPFRPVCCNCATRVEEKQIEGLQCALLGLLLKRWVKRGSKMVNGTRFRDYVTWRVAAVASTLLLLPGAAYAKCLSPSDAVAGTLRKVTIRDLETRKLITNWHIVPTEPVCVKIGDITWKNQLDIQIEFAKSVDVKKMDDELGMPIGFKGKIVGYRDPRDTADIIVTEAKPYGELNPT